MKWLLTFGLAALCWLASLQVPAPAQSQQPPLTATWHESRELTITWQASESVCAWLVGGGRLDKPLAVPCGLSGTAELTTGGTDQDYTPLGRTIELRNINSQTVHSLAVPVPNQVILPVVVR